MQIQHILLATDLSDEALRPFGPVIALAKSIGSRVTVLHVVDDLPIAPHGAPLAPPISPPDLAREIEKARTQLLKQCETIDADVEVKAEVISHEVAAKGIIDYAEQHDVDVIALSTHGRTGFRRLALGSVAEAVLRRSPIPVLSFHRIEE